MSFANGVFSRLYNWIADRDLGVKIRADRMDAEFDGIKDALNEITAGTVQMIGPIKGYDGTVAAPGYGFNSDTNTGMYHIEADDLGFAVGGTKILEITTAGIVITGTITPSGNIKPSANDGASLGVSGTAFADLFLASGGVINWNAGDVTVTHSADSLAFAGASSGYSFDAALSVSGQAVLTAATGQPLDADLTALASAFSAASASGPASLKFAEDTDNGANYARIIAPASLGSDIDLTLPSSAGTIALTSDIAGAVSAASQAEQEASTEAAKYVAPATQQFHPSAAKFWALVSADGSTLSASYNLTSRTDTGTGNLLLTIATDFSSANWVHAMGANSEMGANLSTTGAPTTGTKAAGTLQLRYYLGGAAAPGTAADPSQPWNCVGYGDQ